MERLQADGDEDTEMETGGADYDDNEPSFFLPVPQQTPPAGRTDVTTQALHSLRNTPLLPQEYSEPDLPLPEMKSQIYSSDPPIPAPPEPETEFESEDDYAYEEPANYEAEAASRENENGKVVNTAAGKKKLKKQLPKSKHGIEYPLFPRRVVKQLASKITGKSISNETLNAIVAASEAFFEQVGEDLEAFARHARRRTVEDGDVVLLMRRQRQLNASTTTFGLAERHLPRELLHEIRMPVKSLNKASSESKKQKLPVVAEEGE
ncbi:hypothetical protein RUND412_011488 [Rhizina undulata]